MKKSSKAALYSALIFPGAGLYLLKHYVRGSIFFIPALIAILYIIRGISSVMSNLTAQLQRNPEALYDTVKLTHDIMVSIDKQIPFYHQAISLFIISWLISIASSYFAGKKIELNEAEKNS